MSDSSFLGPKLTPPQGGLQRLQQAVHEQRHRRFNARAWIAAGVAAGLVAVSLISVLHSAVQQQHQMDMTVRRALTAAPRTQFENGAYVTLPSQNPNVQILLVGSLPASQVPDTETLQD